jgi:copper chaperone NosL
MKGSMNSFSPSTFLLASWLAVSAISTGGAKEPIPKGHCAVCGMYVANFPDWAASVSFKDGSQTWFDGPKDLFTFLLDLKHFAPKRTAAELAEIRVKDYYGLKSIDGRKAYFVLGGDVMGPMGRELVPFATEAGARDFLKDHHGQRVLTFAEITPSLLKTLE